jgi:hypothetical protein
MMPAILALLLLLWVLHLINCAWTIAMRNEKSKVPCHQGDCWGIHFHVLSPPKKQTKKLC